MPFNPPDLWDDAGNPTRAGWEARGWGLFEHKAEVTPDMHVAQAALRNRRIAQALRGTSRSNEAVYRGIGLEELKKIRETGFIGSLGKGNVLPHQLDKPLFTCYTDSAVNGLIYGVGGIRTGAEHTVTGETPGFVIKLRKSDLEGFNLIRDRAMTRFGNVSHPTLATTERIPANLIQEIIEIRGNTQAFSANAAVHYTMYKGKGKLSPIEQAFRAQSDPSVIDKWQTVEAMWQKPKSPHKSTRRVKQRTSTEKWRTNAGRTNPPPVSSITSEVVSPTPLSPTPSIPAASGPLQTREVRLAPMFPTQAKTIPVISLAPANALQRVAYSGKRLLRQLETSAPRRAMSTLLKGAIKTTGGLGAKAARFFR